MASRVWGAISTLGASELVRLVDEESGDAVGNAFTVWNPLSNAGLAVTNAAVDGDLSRLQEAAPFNPTRLAASTTRVAAATTRGIPGVNNVTAGAHALASGAETWTHGIVGSAINNIVPAQRGAPDLDGYAFACATVMDEIYKTPENRRADFTDKENDRWVRNEFGVDLPEPANRDEICVYSSGDVATVGCRGSKEGVDWYESNACIALGAVPPRRCAEAEAFVKSLMRQKKFRKIYHAGHSLGGTIALYVGLKLGLSVHAFNAGAGPGDPIAKSILEYAGNSKYARGAVIHRIRNDVVSAFSSQLEGMVEVKVYNQTKRGLAHGSHQFL
mmetsp:Transcript_96431/g.267930  ORF Transcript_96431/g.267930 Transcript_96431/m.267930 type:complete len:330 (+) Transcript_96431:94-1083(+)|eukprot:CAMPEP_0179023984 /NCGR_PEP_ID=MMETSP0796-20121207/7219_1 /TAXON_ID=73915 /ORGANISM="Pyrodinium bahamense, Strain pbaha01" /LENGTH=329 /DNA_ID=CAMNT_0020719927 /DNA_START=94 /DNA_END=1083 /DNA_ORIENTATION=+